MKYYFYATKKTDGIYRNIFPTEQQVKMCGDNSPLKIEVIIDDTGNYVGWLDNTKKLQLVYENIVLLQMCFPYPIKNYIERGEGSIVRLSIKECRI